MVMQVLENNVSEDEGAKKGKMLTSQREKASSSSIVRAWWIAFAVYRVSQGFTAMQERKPL